MTLPPRHIIVSNHVCKFFIIKRQRDALLTENKQKHEATDGLPRGLSLQQISDLLLGTFRRHKFRLLAGFLALITVDFLQLLIPRIIKKGVDGLAAQQVTTTDLLHLGAIILSIASGVVVLRFCWRYLIIGFSRILEQNVRNRIFDHILKMDSVFLRSTRLAI